MVKQKLEVLNIIVAKHTKKRNVFLHTLTGRATFEETFKDAQRRKVQLWQLLLAGPATHPSAAGRAPAAAPAPALLGLLSTRVALLHKAFPASAPDLNTPVLFSTNLSLHQAFFASDAPGFSAPEILSTKVFRCASISC